MNLTFYLLESILKKDITLWWIFKPLPRFQKCCHSTRTTNEALLWL